MHIVKDLSPAKITKLIDKDQLNDATILHYTGDMFGIGCRVSSQSAIDKIVSFKQRPANTGFIILIPDISWLDAYQVHVPHKLRTLLTQFWPGNLTVVLKSDIPAFDKFAIHGKVSFRVPGYKPLRHFIELLREPMISTSVNISTLPAENDPSRLLGKYKHWFDVALMPAEKDMADEAVPSTLIECIDAMEPGNSSGIDEIKCLREGSVPFYSIKQSFSRPLITFVCTANICRSPIAEKLFNFYAKKEGIAFQGDSAGLMQGGHQISLNSMQLLLEKGIQEAQSHVSKTITRDMIDASRLILTMEERHRTHLRSAAPDASHKILTLNEAVGEFGDVEDPYGSDLDSYRITYRIIEDRIIRLINMIKQNEV